LAQNGPVGVELPEIDRQEFVARLSACSPELLLETQSESLYRHYSELRRWNSRISLVGPVGADRVVERHYGESLAALPLLSKRQGVILDLGSGAGFPGFVLAVARPEVGVTLVEANGRKWSFLKSVCRSAALSSQCLNARVGPTPIEGLPQRIDWITTRAVRFEDLGLPALLPRLVIGGSLLLWGGAENPALPSSLRIKQEIHLAGSINRRIVQIIKTSDASRDE